MNAESRQFQRNVESLPGAEEEDLSLPAWIYHDPEFFEVEKQTIFRTSWQLVCHASDIPQVGDYHSFDLFGQSVFVVRGEDGQPRSFEMMAPYADELAAYRLETLVPQGRVTGPLGKGEVCLRSFARRMRSLIPESRFLQAPARGWSQTSLLRT